VELQQASWSSEQIAYDPDAPEWDLDEEGDEFYDDGFDDGLDDASDGAADDVSGESGR
jgi:hypothetical protein